MNVVVVGGGAAGFFAALSVKAQHPNAVVTILEKSSKLLAKVRVSGGGRCNVTHAWSGERKLASNYPRGERFLRKSFAEFAVPHTIAWFAQRGVELKIEDDGRMFPVTDDSATIIDLFMREADDLGVRIRTATAVTTCSREASEFQLVLNGTERLVADRVIITSGGHPKREGYAWMDPLGHSIIPPVPSLFTFNMPGESIRELMGIVVNARVRVVGLDLESNGPVLITHWGMSGPAILKLSAWGARELHAAKYSFTAQLNWLGGLHEEEVRRRITDHADTHSRKQISNADPFQLPKRFWAHLLDKAAIEPVTRWENVGKKDRNRLIDLLTNDRYQVTGKTTFKEEFVTAGGIDLNEVDPRTLESKLVPGLFFAGEVLDIDGITGGFNFQAAWTTGFIAGRSAAS